ncbi:ABC transporter of LPS O-antigen [Legionella pneumophila]|uniref:hypothetical protein n=1 Tax=Legionella pneumophila TaxID=446 RepID=UPI000DFC6EA0|nr:hypothetical protein [Legionella pneumophila]STX65052.1 ABC transporter of LPS O-antigen [Legionella pneumophila]
MENLCKQYQIGNTNTTAAELINKKLKQIFLFSELRKRNKLPANKETSSSIAQEGRTVIDPSQLSADYPNHFWALKDINLEIEAGERLGIIGQKWLWEKHAIENSFTYCYPYQRILPLSRSIN